MGTDLACPKLSARCPSCGSEHSAATLGELTKAVQGCCGKSRTRKARQQRKLELPLNEARPELPWAVRFDRLVISQNRTTYSHWSKHHGDKADWLTRVRLRTNTFAGMKLEWSRWHLERVYCPPKRELDFANFVGGAKPLIDCLIDCGIIKDDSPKHFKCDYTQTPGDVNETILTLVEYADERPPPNEVR